MDYYHFFIFDLEGTLWNGSHKVDSAFECLNNLHNEGKSLFFLSNDSTRTRKSAHSKLKKFGFEADIDHVYPSPYLACHAIKWRYPTVKRVYVIGMEGLAEEARDAGFEVVSSIEHNKKVISSDQEFLDLPVDGIQAVIVGFDINFNYYKLAFASMIIQNGGHFFATDQDGFDMIGKKKGPGCGALVSALQKATEVEPIVFGKPGTLGLEYIIQNHNIDKERAIIIGDKIENDIKLGNELGIDSCLVLSGATHKDDWRKEATKGKGSILPTYVIEKVSP